ncbi:glycosyl hydrolase [Caulobacter endophyticus]|uniref:glycosyl hydrolase n=1 Tax=Caulobacter endophyticus TaxID=2172652 RepID=UPI00240F308D|nr:glycosyl hydrolase [Caulobacter endophyticus]MDG2527211.1 glycosyl hydrolase [Caulobacter endophyticus]
MTAASIRARLLGASAVMIGALAALPASAGQDPLWSGFVTPPADARPMMRWWWFGPAVSEAELDRELAAMKAGGIGGVEVQPVYPLAPDGAAANTPYLSDSFQAALRHAARTARTEGLRFDVTLGSGWPFGGPHVAIDHASSDVRMRKLAVPAGATEIVLPALGPGETWLDVRVGEPGTDAAAWPRLPASGSRVGIQSVPAPREALVFIAGRTGQQVKRAAIGAEGYVIDHLDRAAVDNHLAKVGDRLMEAFDGLPPPDAVFSDSLEAYGASWTGDFAAEFRKRRGYDLLDHLPALFLETDGYAEIRYDWARTLSELVDERYLAPVDAWAKRRGTRFRGQIYGFPAPTLSSNALVALPEGEGDNWRGFTSTRWATSAAHLYARPVVSSEVWTWLHSPSWAATPLDMKMEADRHFLQGVNQLVGHGWPYSPPEAGAPGQAFYAAAALSDRNPWYGAMPEVSRYLQRASHLLRQGQPGDRVAIYLPIEDAFAAMTPARTSANEAMPHRLPEGLVARVLDAGYGFDFIDAEAVKAGRLKHRVLVLPPMTRIDAKAYAAISAWIARGGRVVALGHLPATAGGRLDHGERKTAAALARRLASNRSVSIVAENDVGTALHKVLPPDLSLAAPTPELGFVRRSVDGRDLYFLVNTGNRPIKVEARFETAHARGEWWDPMTARRGPAGNRDHILVDLAPYESRFLVFAPDATGAIPAPSLTSTRRALGDGWSLAIDGHAPRPLATLSSWTDEPALAHFSGVGVYRRGLRLEPQESGRCLTLDFGAGVQTTPPKGARPQAALAAPVREAAVVSVNGARIGAVWAPPYRIDLGRSLKPGDNLIEVAVGNTNLNLLAGRAPADFKLLNARYGERFKMQDQDRIAVQPSGLLAAPTLEERACD